MEKSVDNVEKCGFSTVIHRVQRKENFGFRVHIRLHNFGFLRRFSGYVAMENHGDYPPFFGKKLSFSPIGAENVWCIWG